MRTSPVLEIEEPSTFTEALDVALGLDGYELISGNEQEYGRQVLRRIGADDEILDTSLNRNFFPASYHAMRCVYPAKYVTLLCADLGVV
mgnify:CR=1 FL=1